MSPKISIVFAAVAFTLAAASFQSASANYAPCIENPEAAGCPMARTPLTMKALWLLFRRGM
jgi:hypothetical protein